MAEWRKTYKALARLLHPDKNGSVGEDDNKTKAFKVGGAEEALRVHASA